MKSKILISVTRNYILESYFEEIIKRLGNEFIIDQGYACNPPFENFVKNPLSNGNNPMMLNPDNYDLIIPHFHTHWNTYGDQHWWESGYLNKETGRDDKHKIGLVLFDCAWDRAKECAVFATTNPIIDKQMADAPHFNLRFGINTHLFKPYALARNDKELRVGIIGHYLQPRRMLFELWPKIKNIPGVKFMFFPTEWEKGTNRESERLFQGDYSPVYPGAKWLNGIPNLYNQIDVLLRTDEGIDYGFPIFEAAACGKPVISTDGGNSHELEKAGGAIIIKADKYDDYGNPRDWYMNHTDIVADRIIDAVIKLRDNEKLRREMAWNNWEFIRENWTWENFIPEWRRFFEAGLKKAEEHK